jgi:small subunit ribosomal protein S2
MKRYIFGSRNGIYIIDLQQTLSKFREAYEFIVAPPPVVTGSLCWHQETGAEIVASEAIRSQQFYMNQRWLGGMLTNFTTIKKS